MYASEVHTLSGFCASRPPHETPRTIHIYILTHISYAFYFAVDVAFSSLKITKPFLAIPHLHAQSVPYGRHLTLYPAITPLVYLSHPTCSTLYHCNDIDNG
jgi:hypothetical protein